MSKHGRLKGKLRVRSLSRRCCATEPDSKPLINLPFFRPQLTLKIAVDKRESQSYIKAKKRLQSSRTHPRESIF